jgi:hypothetical protein
MPDSVVLVVEDGSATLKLHEASTASKRSS